MSNPMRVGPEPARRRVTKYSELTCEATAVAAGDNARNNANIEVRVPLRRQFLHYDSSVCVLIIRLKSWFQPIRRNNSKDFITRLSECAYLRMYPVPS